MYSRKNDVIKKTINKNYVILIILHRDKSNYYYKLPYFYI